RVSAVLQHVHANYEIDLFQTLIAAAARETACSDRDSPSLRVLADHIRACSFLIADGVIPGNEGRGYVLRRIIRRAIRHGYKLGARAAFFHRLVADLVAEMGEAYPELREHQSRITAVLKQEEERFFATIENGMEILEAELAMMSGRGIKVFSGETAFKLHDTFGFPLDLTADVCREREVTVDAAAFDVAMARQKELARAAGKFRMAANLEYTGPDTAFHGYERLEERGTVLALYRDGVPVDALSEGEQGVVVLDNTPFYAESGGQVGDRGELRASGGIFGVEDTLKIQAAVFGHHGVVKTGRIALGQAVGARVDATARVATARNHSVTHLMHKALRQVLGSHVQQKGSLVDPDKTRFDFTHTAPLTAEEVREVEELVNDEILANAQTRAEVMALEAAQKTGAMMLFGEKYGEEVRVLSIGSSVELCGGTHVSRTGDIGVFKVVAESGVAAGIRRVEAVTGRNALRYLQEQERRVQGVSALLKVQPDDVAERVVAIMDNARSIERELQR
nr:alanine--tRNA ligase [Zoogloeaceae bacterium]